MTTTQTRVLPDLDEALDWDPTCERGTCSLPAAWLGWNDPCQCITLHMCDAHKQQLDAIEATFTVACCRTCGGPAGVTWRPL